MKKVRVYELAKELNLESKILVDFLNDLGAEVKNHMSTLEEDIAVMVKEHFSSPEEKGSKIAQSVEIELEDVTPNYRLKNRMNKSGENSTREQHNVNKLHANKQSMQKKGQSHTSVPRSKELEIPETISVKDLAMKLSMSGAAVIKKLMSYGVMASVTQSIDYETAQLVCADFGVSTKPLKDLAETVFDDDTDDVPEQLQERPPVVTIMGHVDHGKTTLLDGIRKTKVTESEAGGITQHIGAYQVDYKSKRITFLDTPGHAAFTAMRSRGARITDIAILVVAADDGVMPQTVEAINHAKAAKVPIIVAVNKMDRPSANPDRIKQELTEYGLVAEEWGGDTIFVEMSALNLSGIDDLLDMILLVSEMESLTANPDRQARGTVVEAQLDKGRGPVATVLVTNGTIRIGDSFAVGNVSGKVRALLNDQGKNIKEAGPSQPVEILGISDVPAAGDILVVTPDEHTARQVAHLKQIKHREQELRQTATTSLDDLFAQIQQGEVQELNIVIKADVQGSLEALRSSLEKLSTDEVRIHVIHQGVGAVSETDVHLAAASNAIIIGFNVRPEPNAKRASDKEKVEVRNYRIIYNVIDDIKSAMAGLLAPDFVEETLGRAQVRQTFKVPTGVIAGCYVTEGKIVRSAQVRLLRDNVVVHEGILGSLKRFKDDAKEVAHGYECGIGIDRFNDLKEGDVIEAFIMKEIARTL